MLELSIPVVISVVVGALVVGALLGAAVSKWRVPIAFGRPGDAQGDIGDGFPSRRYSLRVPLTDDRSRTTETRAK